jgi:hypothetical protein
VEQPAQVEPLAMDDETVWASYELTGVLTHQVAPWRVGHKWGQSSLRKGRLTGAHLHLWGQTGCVVLR